MENEWNLKEDALSLDWFKQNSKQFTSFGRDMEQLFTYTKICHSRRIYGKSEEKKNIDKEDIINGFKMFIDNRKESKLDNIDTNILYSLYC